MVWFNNWLLSCITIFCWILLMVEGDSNSNGSQKTNRTLVSSTDKIPEENLPSYCFNPNGTDCTWYSQCLAKTYPCTGSPSEYAINYGYKFCNLYVHTYKYFSKNGKTWLDAARKCLQVDLVPLLSVRPAPTCEEIKSTAFKTHVPCYAHPTTDLSVCQLPVRDLLTIFYTIKSAFVDDFTDTTGTLLKTVLACLEGNQKDVPNSERKDLLSMFKLNMKLMSGKSVNRGQDVTKWNSDAVQEVMRSIFSNLGWNLVKNIDWFAFPEESTNLDDSPDNYFHLVLINRDYEVAADSERQTSDLWQRTLNDTIVQLIDIVENGLEVLVGNTPLKFRMTSLHSCHGSGINNTCQNTSLLATWNTTNSAASSSTATYVCNILVCMLLLNIFNR